MAISKKSVIIILTVAVLILCGVVFYVSQKDKNTPTLKIAIIVTDKTENSCKIKWEVTTISDDKVNFIDGNQCIFMLDNQVHEKVSKDNLVLNSGEKYTKEFELNDLSIENHTIKITALCEEGTKASMIEYFEIK